jgi:hypothetical protein
MVNLPERAMRVNLKAQAKAGEPPLGHSAASTTCEKSPAGSGLKLKLIVSGAEVLLPLPPLLGRKFAYE